MCEPTEEDVAAIVVALIEQQTTWVKKTESTRTRWQEVARREAVDRWDQPTRMALNIREDVSN